MLRQFLAATVSTPHVNLYTPFFTGLFIGFAIGCGFALWLHHK